MTLRECGCTIDADGLTPCGEHRPVDRPLRKGRCGTCKELGHTSRTCGMTPEQRAANRRGGPKAA